MSPAAVATEAAIGEVVADLEIGGAWAVDPATGREGPADLVVAEGILREVSWLEGRDADGVDPDGVIVAPGFIDLHVHLREPGNEDAETIASGLAAAAHGGFTTVCAMPNTDPALDEPSVLARIRAAAGASGSPVQLLAHGAVTVGRAGQTLAALGELADAGVIGFSDDGAPVASAALLRSALLYAGALGLPIVDHPDDPAAGGHGEVAAEGLAATILGLPPVPSSGEAIAIARDIAVLEDVLRDEPRARLHLTHVSTAAALRLIADAKGRGLPVTCDVTPHHLAMTDDWLAGSRRWAWLAGDDPWTPGGRDARPYDPSLRVNPPIRPAADAAACLEAAVDGTADAVATDHAPHRSVDKDVEFGMAAPGISGIETALGVLLEAVGSGRLNLARAIAALTTGPAAVLGTRLDRSVGLVEGAPADLVVFDRSDAWTVSAGTLASKSANTPLLGRSLPGRVLVTVAGGRLAHMAEA